MTIDSLVSAEEDLDKKKNKSEFSFAIIIFLSVIASCSDSKKKIILKLQA